MKFSQQFKTLYISIRIFPVEAILSIAKKNSIAIFLPLVLMYQKREIFASVVVQNRETKNRRLGMFVTSFQEYKLRENQISPTFSYFLINNALLYHFLAN